LSTASIAVKATDDYLASTLTIPPDYFCYHEAGHAITAHIFGQVEFITAGSAWKVRDGLVIQDEPAECFATLDNDLDRAIFCCGGGVATLHKYGSEEGSVEDYAAAAEYFDNFDDALLIAKDLIAAGWDWVELIATVLHKEQTMTGERFRQLLEAHEHEKFTNGGLSRTEDGLRATA
jgi:hypothetical protein